MRLTAPGIRPSSRTITIRFNGKPVAALEGESVAAALSAAEIVAFRHSASGAPRGLHCGMGACFDCVVTIDGRMGQRACLTKVADGMAVTGVAPPEPAPLTGRAEGEDAEERVCDVLVVGAGPAGLAAAIAAAEAGADVVVLDEREAPGGQYLKPLAASHHADAPDAQFRLGEALRARAQTAGARIESGATVWGGFGADEIAAVVGGVAVTYRPRRLILAPGAHERPVPLPGWTLPGVMTTGALQTLARAQRVSPGRRVLIAGNGPLNFQLACEMLAGGAEIVAVVEAAPRPGARRLADLARLLRHAPDLAGEGLRYVRALRRAGVPVLWASRVVALEGEGGAGEGSTGSAGGIASGGRVQAALLESPGGTRRIAADVVALNMGFQPEVGLARALDLPHRFVDTGIGHLATEADEEGRAGQGNVFAIGDGAALGGARVALARGRLAGLAAARDLAYPAPPDPEALKQLKRALAFQQALWRVFEPPAFDAAALADDTIVCRCEEITAGSLRREIGDGLMSLAALKKATRAGMGRCQGRFCAATVARLCPQAPDPWAFAAPRMPVRPVPAAPLMFEAPEFEAPLIPTPTPPVRFLPVPDLAEAERRCEVLVIGGGAVGLSCAYFLAREGAEVMLAERDETGMTASTANAGSLHAQMLSYDFDETTPPDGGPAGRCLPLFPRSIALWKEIAAEAGESLGISTKGGLMLADSAAGLEWLRAKQRMEARCGLESHVIGQNELRSMAPHLSARMVGAVFCPAEGRIDPLGATRALARLARRHGATLLRGAAVTAIARDGKDWQVRTAKGTIRARRVVNATGPFAAAIAAMVGLDIPVTGTVQQVIVTEPAPPLVDHLVAYAHRHLSLKQQDSGGLLIGGGWFGAYDPASGRTRNLRRNVQGNLWVAGRVLPALRGLSIIRAWTGINVAADRSPILGEAPGLPGFFNAIAPTGFTLAPVLGKMTAEAVLRGAPIDPAYSVARFALQAQGRGTNG